MLKACKLASFKVVYMISPSYWWPKRIITPPCKLMWDRFAKTTSPDCAPDSILWRQEIQVASISWKNSQEKWQTLLRMISDKKMIFPETTRSPSNLLRMWLVLCSLKARDTSTWFTWIFTLYNNFYNKAIAISQVKVG